MLKKVLCYYVVNSYYVCSLKLLVKLVHTEAFQKIIYELDIKGTFRHLESGKLKACCSF